MGQTLALADAVLKEDYHGPLRKQINDKTAITAQMTRNTETLVGRRAILPCHMTRNSGVGSRLEGETLPTAGNQGTVDEVIGLHYHYGKVRLTKQTITRMASDRGAFIKATKLEMKGLASDCTRDQERQIAGTSNGVMATCGTTAASTTVQLLTTTPEQMLVNLLEGATIDIGTVANPQAVAGNRAVTSVDFTNKTVTISGAAVSTTSGTHFIFRQGNGGSGVNQRENTGLQTMISNTGTLFGIDPTVYQAWQSIVDSNGGTLRPISENLVEKTSHRAENRSGEEVDSLWCEDGVYRAAANLLTAQKRMVNTLELKGGHKGLEFNFGTNGAPLMKARDLPPNQLFGLNHASLELFVDEDWTWEDTDGSVLTRAADNTHSFEAIYYSFLETATTRRNAHFLITDLEVA